MFSARRDASEQRSSSTIAEKMSMPGNVARFMGADCQKRRADDINQPLPLREPTDRVGNKIPVGIAAVEVINIIVMRTLHDWDAVGRVANNEVWCRCALAACPATSRCRQISGLLDVKEAVWIMVIASSEFWVSIDLSASQR
jgi:hypothetical protein